MRAFGASGSRRIRRLYVVVLGLVSVLAAGAGAGAGAGAETTTIDRTWSAPPRPAVEVEITAGRLRVVGVDGRRIELEGTAGPDAALDVDQNGRWTRLRVVRPAGAQVGARLDLAADLVLRVPRGSDLEIRGPDLDVEVDAVDGRVTTESVTGDVRLRGAPREVEASSATGSFELDVETPRIVARTVDGSIRIGGAVAELTAETVDGSLIVSAAVGAEARLLSVLGDLRVHGPLAPTARLVARTSSGAVEVHLPPVDQGGGAEVVAVSRRGSFRDPAATDALGTDPSFGGDGSSDATSGPYRAVYRLGSEPRRVEIETFDGPIRLVRPATLASRTEEP